MQLLSRGNRDSESLYLNQQTNTLHLLLRMKEINNIQPYHPDGLMMFFKQSLGLFDNMALTQLLNYKRDMEIDLKGKCSSDGVIERRRRIEYVDLYINLLEKTQKNVSVNQRLSSDSQLLVRLMKAVDQVVLSDVLSKNQADSLASASQFHTTPILPTKDDVTRFKINYQQIWNDPLIQMDVSLINRLTQQYENTIRVQCDDSYLFDAIKDSPFYCLNSQGQAYQIELSFLTLFFLMELNIFCIEQNLVPSTMDFSEILIKDSRLTQFLATQIKEALQTGMPVETAFIYFVNNYLPCFGLKTPVSDAHFLKVMERFMSDWVKINNIRRFNFMLLTVAKRPFVTHRNDTVVPFVKIVRVLLPEENVDNYVNDFNTIIDNCNNVSSCDFIRNCSDEHTLTFDLSTMEKADVIRLYESLDSFENQCLKNEFLVELTLKRPELLFEVICQDFLHYVSYGDVFYSEALLKTYPELVQKLLRAHGIAFTDPAGRTFFCSAYEYAYWNKDINMQEWLGSLMDETTKQLIVERMLDSTTKESKKCLYTTKNEQGHIIEHQDNGFDFLILQNAYKNYLDEWWRHYSNDVSSADNIKALEAARDLLDELWEKVGAAQGKMPIHYLQEMFYADSLCWRCVDNPDMLSAYNPASTIRKFWFELNNGQRIYLYGCNGISSKLGAEFTLAKGGGEQVLPQLSNRIYGGFDTDDDLKALTNYDNMISLRRHALFLSLNPSVSLSSSTTIATGKHDLPVMGLTATPARAPILPSAPLLPNVKTNVKTQKVVFNPNDYYTNLDEDEALAAAMRASNLETTKQDFFFTHNQRTSVGAPKTVFNPNDYYTNLNEDEALAAAMRASLVKTTPPPLPVMSASSPVISTRPVSSTSHARNNNEDEDLQAAIRASELENLNRAKREEDELAALIKLIMEQEQAESLSLDVKEDKQEEKIGIIQNASHVTLFGGKIKQQEMENLENDFACPITQEIMVDPVIFVLDGHTYERAVITEWLTAKKTSPIDSDIHMKPEQTIENVLVPNLSLRKAIESYQLLQRSNGQNFHG